MVTIWFKRWPLWNLLTVSVNSLAWIYIKETKTKLPDVNGSHFWQTLQMNLQSLTHFSSSWRDLAAEGWDKLVKWGVQITASQAVGGVWNYEKLSFQSRQVFSGISTIFKFRGENPIFLGSNALCSLSVLFCGMSSPSKRAITLYHLWV